MQKSIPEHCPAIDGRFSESTLGDHLRADNGLRGSEVENPGLFMIKALQMLMDNRFGCFAVPNNGDSGTGVMLGIHNGVLKFRVCMVIKGLYGADWLAADEPGGFFSEGVALPRDNLRKCEIEVLPGPCRCDIHLLPLGIEELLLFRWR